MMFNGASVHVSTLLNVHPISRQPKSVAGRWAIQVVKFCDSEDDLKTLKQWAKFTGISYSSLCERCRLIRVARSLPGMPRSDARVRQDIDAHVVNTYLKRLAVLPGLGLGKAALEALRAVTGHPSLLHQLHSSPSRASTLNDVA